MLAQPWNLPDVTSVVLLDRKVNNVRPPSYEWRILLTKIASQASQASQAPQAPQAPQASPAISAVGRPATPPALPGRQLHVGSLGEYPRSISKFSLTFSGLTATPRYKPPEGWTMAQETELWNLFEFLGNFTNDLNTFEAGSRQESPRVTVDMDHYLSTEYHFLSVRWRTFRQRYRDTLSRRNDARVAALGPAQPQPGSARTGPVAAPAPTFQQQRSLAASDQALEQRPQHTQDPSQSARDSTRLTPHARCNVYTGCQLPSSLAEGWVALRQFETELAAWDSDQAPFPPPMPKPCLIHWFCTAYEDTAQMWQQLEPGLQRAMREFRSPG